MKEMRCLDCKKTFKANSPEEMLLAMMPHYESDHAEMMKSGNERKRKEWMKKFYKNWEKAKEIK